MRKTRKSGYAGNNQHNFPREEPGYPSPTSTASRFSNKKAAEGSDDYQGNAIAMRQVIAMSCVLSPISARNSSVKSIRERCNPRKSHLVVRSGAPVAPLNYYRRCRLAARAVPWRGNTSLGRPAPDRVQVDSSGFRKLDGDPALKQLPSPTAPLHLRMRDLGQPRGRRTNDDGTHKRLFLSVGRDVGQRLLFRRAPASAASLRRRAIRLIALAFRYRGLPTLPMFDLAHIQQPTSRRTVRISTLS